MTLGHSRRTRYLTISRRCTRVLTRFGGCSPRPKVGSSAPGEDTASNPALSRTWAGLSPKRTTGPRHPCRTNHRSGGERTWQPRTGPDQRPADVLVVFGITGDLAKVMTFRSLYRLELRGLLGLPDRRRRCRRLDAGPARGARSRVDRGHGRGHRQGGVRPVRREAVVRPRRLHRPRHLPAGRRRDQGRRVSRLLPGDPAVPVRDGGQGPGRGGSDGIGSRGGREAVRARPDLRARAGGRAAPVPRRVPAVPHRPLPREDGDRRDPAPAVRERHPRAGVEPRLRLVRADQHVRGLRGRGPRPLLRSRRSDA